MKPFAFSANPSLIIILLMFLPIYSFPQIKGSKDAHGNMIILKPDSLILNTGKLLPDKTILNDSLKTEFSVSGKSSIIAKLASRCSGSIMINTYDRIKIDPTSTTQTFVSKDILKFR